MPNAVERAIAAATSALKATNGVSVVYSKGPGQVSGAITAIVGETEFEDVDEQGIVISGKSRDYLIAADELLINSVQVAPENGDTIVETVGSTTFVYEVSRIPGGKHFQPSDPYGARLRIHTKLMRTA